MKYWYSLAVLMTLGACAQKSETLTVKQFYLRDQEDDSNIEPMIRGEKKRLLHGAVSMEERKGRLGQYYTVLWNDAAGVGAGEVEVRFEYQQGGSGSLIKRRSEKFSSETSTGKAVFSVVGDDYFKRGKVLTWKVSVLRGGGVLDSKQSYLWK